MFLSTLITHMPIHAIKALLFKISKNLEVRHFRSYGQWAKAIGAGVSHSVEGLGMTPNA